MDVNTARTPGDWAVDRINNVVSMDNPAHIVARCNYVDPEIPVKDSLNMDIANAKLISKSPKILGFLIQFDNGEGNLPNCKLHQEVAQLLNSLGVVR